ncbi:kinase-like domain-containing protein [Xylaria telfairii]|nr:kinase-like domain-containing protein [Xylaria telfairii]
MSWNFIKKLKDGHISSFSNISRQLSSATDNSRGKHDQWTPQRSDSITALGTGNPLAQLNASKQPPIIEQGILTITLYEAHGLSLPKEYEHSFSRPGESRSAGLSTIHNERLRNYIPYALIDFDKVQVYVSCTGGDLENPSWAGSSTQHKFDVSRVACLTIHLFANPPSGCEGPQGILLGYVRLTPRFDSKLQFEEGSSNKDHKQTSDDSHVTWADIQHGTGRLRVGVKYVENEARKLGVSDFELLKVIGQGNFGKVMQVRKKDTNRVYAMKSVQKGKVIAHNKVASTLAERSVLAQVNNPFIVPLKFTFQTPEKLYFVLAFINGGELFYHLSREKRFSVDRSRLYAAELLCALECLHELGVIYRDLKPENILLDYQGHIALCDFGLCKLGMKDQDQTNTFCGTSEYLAPEIIRGDGYNKTVDWWTLGVLLWEMLIGIPPFYHRVADEMYRRILCEPLYFPSFITPVAKDLLTKLLDREPTNRLGSNGSAEIKAHPFFGAIEWRRLLERKYEPTFKPNVSDALDITNFDTDFTSQAPQDSHVDGPALSRTMQHQFAGFSYNRPVSGLSDMGGTIDDY